MSLAKSFSRLCIVSQVVSSRMLKREMSIKCHSLNPAGSVQSESPQKGAGLKIQCPQGREGSSPSFGTSFREPVCVKRT